MAAKVCSGPWRMGEEDRDGWKALTKALGKKLRSWMMTTS
jgi:hypothetical protein